MAASSTLLVSPHESVKVQLLSTIITVQLGSNVSLGKQRLWDQLVVYRVQPWELAANLALTGADGKRSGVAYGKVR